MIELPETVTLADQLNKTIRGKKVVTAVAAYSPHTFTWYHGDPKHYHPLLKGKTVDRAVGIGSMVEITVDDAIVLLSEGPDCDIMTTVKGTEKTSIAD